MEGRKEILGLYLSESEGANFWLSVLTDLNNRGLKDILIASVDGLKGFPEAIKAIFPKTEVQLCIIHQIRNSLRYVASKDQMHTPEQFGQPADLHPDTLPELIRIASRFIFGQF